MPPTAPSTLHRPAVLRRLALGVAILLVISGCATRQQTIHRHLTNAGLPPAVADCLAPELDHRLTTDELKRLGRALHGFDAGSDTGMISGNLADRAHALRRHLKDSGLSANTIATASAAGLACLGTAPAFFRRSAGAAG